MAEKEANGIQKEDAVRSSSVADINLNKNLDAKSVPCSSNRPSFSST